MFQYSPSLQLSLFPLHSCAGSLLLWAYSAREELQIALVSSEMLSTDEA